MAKTEGTTLIVEYAAREVTTSDGKSFIAYDTFVKNKRFALKFRKEITNTPNIVFKDDKTKASHGFIKVDVTKINKSTQGKYPCYWVQEIEGYLDTEDIAQKKAEQVANDFDKA